MKNSFFFLIIVKPIIKIFYHEKELITKTLTVLENTYEKIHCQILSNPSIISKIEWVEDDRLILGKDNSIVWSFCSIRYD